jgi:lipoprotein-releasing system ATP-binding protein
MFIFMDLGANVIQTEGSLCVPFHEKKNRVENLDIPIRGLHINVLCSGHLHLLCGVKSSCFMIQAKGIIRSYGPLQVLKGVDLHIAKGEIVSIVGASGAGKSTLLHILGTLDKSDGGELEIAGHAVHKLSAKQLAQFRNKHVGFIFQFHNLLPEFDALENVCIPAFIAGIPRVQAEARGQELLTMLGLGERVHHKPNELSGGEQQRVAVARALMNKPDVIFADEPSGNLDSKNARELHELFFSLRDQLQQTFVIVTHNEDLARMADRTLVMRDGKL